MFLELEFTNINKRVSLETFEDIRPWLEAEKSFWNWVGNQFRKSPQLQKLWKHLNDQWNSIDQAIRNAEQHREADNFQGFVDNFQDQLTQIVNSKKFLLSSSPQAAFINDLKEKYPVVAAYALSYFLGFEFQPDQNASFQGYATAFLHEKGLVSNIDAEKKSLSDLKIKFHSEFDSQLDRIKELSGQFETLKSQIEETHKEQGKQFSEFREKGLKDLQEIEDIYDKKLALQSSVTYWENKGKLHEKLSRIFGGVSFCTIIGLAVGLGWGSYLLLLTEADKPPYWKLALLGIIAVLGVWLARLIVRIFLSHLHLGTDAKERVTMIQTYLALLREEHGLKDDERQLILQTLFRPSATGIVKDDGIPPSLVEIASRFK